MEHLFDHLNAVQVVTLAAGIICFGLYIWLTVDAARDKPAVDAVVQATATQAKAIADPPAGGGENFAPPSLDDFTKLMEAAAKLTDSLSKATPTLTALIGAILLFAIATAGTFASPAAAPGAPAKECKDANGKKITCVVPPAGDNRTDANDSAPVDNKSG